jgi:hypothetical protein
MLEIKKPGKSFNNEGAAWLKGPDDTVNFR